MRKLILSAVALAVVASLTLAQNAFEAIDYNIMGAGARAHGMGGAFIGVADDATAISWNPAGIAQLEKMEASAVGLLSIKNYSGEFTLDTQSEKNSESTSHITPSFASFAVPLKVSQRNLVLTVAYQRMIDFGYSYKDITEYSTYTETYTAKAKGGVDAVSPAIGFQITPQVNLGLAMNFYLNKLNRTSEWSYSDGDLQTTEREWKFSGMNFNTGILITTPKFNIGATVKTPFALKTESSFSQENNDPAAFGWPATYDTTFPEAEETYPLMFGLGIAFKPTDKLTFAFDFERRNYENSEWHHKEWKAGTLYDSVESMGWKNVSQLRAGIEYVLAGPSALFPIRLGFRTDPKVFNKWEGSFTNPDTSQAVGMVFTGGFGLIMGSVMFDLAYEYGMTTLADVEGSLAGYEASWLYKEKAHNIMASIIYHFK